MNYSTRVPPLAIGGLDADGSQRYAVSLDLVQEPVVMPAARAWVAWRDIETVCGFTRQERTVWRHCWRDGTQSTTMLGLTRNQVGAANREILRKLRKNKDALHGFLGYRTVFEIELENVLATTRFRANSKCISERLRMTIAELTEKKTTEVAKLGRIQERTRGARLAWEDAQSAVTRIETVLRAEQEAAVLAEQDWPSPAAEKTLASARAKVASAESAYSAAQAAMERQSQIVEGVEGELFGRRMEIFETELAPAKENLFALMREFCEAACHVEQIAQRHGIGPHTLPMVLYPSADGFTGLSERNARCALINGGLNLTAFLRNNYIGRTV
jgi:hypothetical protein